MNEVYNILYIIIYLGIPIAVLWGAAWHDKKTREIPRILTVPFIGVGSILAVRGAPADLPSTIAFILVVVPLGIFLDRRDKFGFGDTLLLVGLALWFHWIHALAVLWLAGILAFISQKAGGWFGTDRPPFAFAPFMAWALSIYIPATGAAFVWFVLG